MKILPKNLKVFKLHSVFIKLLIIFTCFILVSVLLVGASSYINSSKRLLQEVKKSNILILKQSRDTIDKELSRINDISLKMALDKQVGKASYLNPEETASNMSIYNDIVSYLNQLRSTSDIYSNIWIRFNKSKNIVNYENDYSENVFFNEVCVYKSDLNWEKLFKENFVLSSIGRQEIYYNYSSKPVITLIRSIPVGSIEPMGSIVINMDEKVLSSVISGIDESNPILTYIIDSKRNIIFYNDRENQYRGNDELIKGILDKYVQVTSDKEGEIEDTIDKMKYTIEFTSSNINDWKYITIIPNSFITSKVNDIRNITILIIVLSLIVGMILSYILAKRVYNPINNIVDYLSIISNNRKLKQDDSKANDEFLFINNIINYVYKENENLKLSYNKNLPMLREKLLSDLLDKKVTDINFKEVSESVGLELPFNFFQVIAFEIDDYSQLDKKLKYELSKDITVTFSSIASEIFANDAIVYAVKKGNDKIVTIINNKGSFEDSGNLYEFLNEVIDNFYKNYGVTFTIGIGKAYTELENCSMSFIEALFSLKYKVVKGQNTIIHIDEVKNIPQNIFDYPIEIEKHLVNKLKSGDVESIRTIIEDLFKRNIDNNMASLEMINNFFNALIGTIVRTVYEIQSSVGSVFETENDLYNTVSEKSTIKDKKEYIFYLFETVTKFVNGRKSNHNMKVYEKVIKFIEDNYQKELSLDNVSEVVGLSPSYLSLVFKEVSGMNFVEYVNTYRINIGKNYLKDISLTISEISDKVGYTNSNTFIKVFKKYEGVTPGQYRDTIKPEMTVKQ